MHELKTPFYISRNPKLTEFDKIVFEQMVRFQENRYELITKDMELFMNKVRGQMDRWACKVSNMTKKDITEKAVEKSFQKMERMHLIERENSNEDLYLKEDRMYHPLPRYQNDHK